EVLGSCVGIRLSDFHGNVGMYVVKQEYRGTGIGKQLWNEAIAHLGERNKGLSAVSALLPVYRDKAGFSQIADWSVDLYKLNDASKLCTQFRLDSRNSAPFLLLNSQSRRIANTIQMRELKSDVWNASNKMSVKISQDLIPALIAYDFGLHFYDRSSIVELTVNERDCRGRVALRGDTVLGYGCIKPNLQGAWMIAPLFAENELVARRLLYDLVNSLSASEQKRAVVLKSPTDVFIETLLH
ncbi:hypothetical protein B4U80_12671, partial [Leptotrombidium deliense]